MTPIKEFRNNWINSEVKHTIKMCRAYEGFTLKKMKDASFEIPTGYREGYERYLKLREGYFYKVKNSKAIYRERVTMPLYSNGKVTRTLVERESAIANMMEAKSRAWQFSRNDPNKHKKIDKVHALGAEIVLHVISQPNSTDTLSGSVKKFLSDLPLKVYEK